MSQLYKVDVGAIQKNPRMLISYYKHWISRKSYWTHENVLFLEYSVDMMMNLIGDPKLFVMQVEMDIYSVLKRVSP